MNTIKSINQFNSNLYYTNSKNDSFHSDSKNSDLDFSQNLKEQKKEEYINTPTTNISSKELYNLLKAKTPTVHITEYNPNDISLGITFADKNSETLPTINNVNSKYDTIANSGMNTSIHTTVDGIRFLVIQTTVGEQTFEKSIKLNKNL